MQSIIYVSTVVAPFGNFDLTQLVAQSAARNYELKITGLLAFNGINFMQLLEGPDEAVESTLRRIANDRRHIGLAVIRRRAISRRECEKWAMTGRMLPLSGIGADGAHGLLPEFLQDTEQLFSSFSSIAA
jgi:hypothetical protein